jgi:hypothetical protein
VESCAQRISWDPIGVHVSWRDFRLVSSDLRLLFLAMVVALVLVIWGLSTMTLRLSTTTSSTKISFSWLP